jgi:DNA polymerase-3 subunit beta
MTQEAIKEQSNNSEGELQFDITLSRQELIKAMSHVHSVVEKKNILPILSNVKLGATNNTLQISATDMDVAVTENLPVTVNLEGELTVSAHLFYDILKKMPDSEIKCCYEHETSKLKILGENREFSLSVLPASEFPMIEQVESDYSFSLKSEELKTLIEKTKFAMSTEETRYNLNGIYLHFRDIDSGRYFSSAATDAHRLALSSVLSEEDSNDGIEAPGIILPKKTAFELKKITDEAPDKQVYIELSSSKIKFSCGSFTLISKLIDGNFPDYNAFIPASYKSKLVINTRDFSSVVDRVSTITMEKFRAIKLDIKQNSIYVSATGEAGGSAFETLEGELEGEELEIGFNPRYLLDVLSVIESEQVELQMQDSFSPVLLKAEDEPNSIFVVMPIKV